jgi:hypothetical protein
MSACHRHTNWDLVDWSFLSKVNRSRAQILVRRLKFLEVRYSRRIQHDGKQDYDKAEHSALCWMLGEYLRLRNAIVQVAFEARQLRLDAGDDMSTTTLAHVEDRLIRTVKEPR